MSSRVRSFGRLLVASSFAALAALPALAEEGSVIKDRRIGYVTTQLHWSMYQTPDGKAECPNGLSPNGPREIFAQLFPNLGSVEETYLAREGLKAYPADQGGLKFRYHPVAGKTANGLNLDGKVGPNDFTSPTGELGIDNAFYRVTGCNSNFRGPEGQLQLFANKQVLTFPSLRILLEISELDDLVNDPDVLVTIYRGLDPLVLDATGENVAPGGTQRVDMKWGSKIIQKFKAGIRDGVLTTEARDGKWPFQIFGGAPYDLRVRDMRFNMKLTPTAANGMIGGYYDTESLYKWVTGWSTHHLSYGQLDPVEFYWQIRQHADGHPDKDGRMTSISGALKLDMTQVFIEHPEKSVAQGPAIRTGGAGPSQAARR